MSLRQYINEVNIPFWDIIVYYTKNNGSESINLVCNANNMRKIRGYLKGIEYEGFTRGHEEDGLKKTTLWDAISQYFKYTTNIDLFKIRYKKYPGSKGWEWDWGKGFKKSQVNTIITGNTCKDYNIIPKDADEDEIIETIERFMTTYE